MESGRKLDPADLLTRARQRAGLSKRALASRAGTSRATLWAYETGNKSPTVRQLDRLLAECGLQARATLEPLLADVDERVDALVAGQPVTRVQELARLGASLDKADVGWAADGATALALQGLAATSVHVGVVVRFDEALQRWLRAAMARGCDADGQPYWGSWLEADLATAQRFLGRGAFTVAGSADFRVVDELPDLLTVVVELPGELLDRFSQDDDGPREPSTDLSLRVVAVHEVERWHPAYAEVLERWRGLPSRHG